jgi:hypothetical protein
MLDKADRRYLRASDPAAIVGGIQGAIYQHGIQLQQTGPNMWVGRGTQASYGMVPRVAVTVTPIQDSVCVDVRISADFETNGIVVLVVAWLFFFPVAIILGVLGYQEWERRAMWTMSAIWTPLMPQMINPPAPTWGPPGVAPGAPPGPGGPGPGWGPR